MKKKNLNADIASPLLLPYRKIIQYTFMSAFFIIKKYYCIIK